MAEFNAPWGRYSTRAFPPRPEGAATESVSSLKEQLRAKGVAEREINACFEKRELVALLAKVNAEAASNETMTDALLPAGWARAVDPVTNGVYYQNASTGEKTWDVQAMRTKAEAMGRINIRVRPGVRFDETARGDTKEFRIHKETRLQKIFDAYARFKGVAATDLKFTFLDPDTSHMADICGLNTAEDYGIRDGDYIEVMICNYERPRDFGLSRPVAPPGDGARFLKRAPAPAPSPPASPEKKTRRGDSVSPPPPPEVYEMNKRSVVIIKTRRFPRWQGERVPLSFSGSGFVWDDEGHVVTNYHVIDKAQQVSVTFWAGGDRYASYHANLCNVEPDELKKNDIAVLKVWAPKDRLRPITCGSSSKLRVGDRVYALGSPKELHHSLSHGMVSQFRNNFVTSIQVQSASIAPGSSGSPLLDENGLLVGVNTSGERDTQYHYAIPLDTVRRIIDRETYFPIARSAKLIDNHYPIHKYQNALARAKDALIEIRDGRDTASADHMAAMARNALTEISKALLGDKF